MREQFSLFLDAASKTAPLSEQEAEAFYSYGFSLYGAGKSKEAAEVFEVLCTEHPVEAKYWFALASAKQELGDYDRALHAWAMAAILKSGDPYPHFHAAECSLSLEKFQDASLALAAAFAQTEEGHPLREKIALLRQQWDILGE